jgi:hypothetical protein
MNPRSTRAVFILALIALAIPLSASAAAASSYSISLKVPSFVQTGTQFKVTASGTSAGSAKAIVFLSTKSCAANAVTEASRSGHRVVDKSVDASYKASKTVTAGAPGTYRACAYLTTGSTTRAHAARIYPVVHSGY